MSSDESAESVNIFSSTHKEALKAIRSESSSSSRSTCAPKKKRRKKNQPLLTPNSKMSKNESLYVGKSQPVGFSTPLQPGLTKKVRFGNSSSSGSISAHERERRKKFQISPIYKDPIQPISSNSDHYHTGSNKLTISIQLAENDAETLIYTQPDIIEDTKKEYKQKCELEIEDNEITIIDKTLTVSDDEKTLINSFRSLSTTPEEESVFSDTIQEKSSLDEKALVKSKKNQSHAKKKGIRKRKSVPSLQNFTCGRFYDLAWMSIHNVGKRIFKEVEIMQSFCQKLQFGYLTYSEWRRKLEAGEIIKTPPPKNKEDVYIIRKEKKEKKRKKSSQTTESARFKNKKYSIFKNKEKEIKQKSPVEIIKIDERIRDNALTENELQKSHELSDDFAVLINHPNVTIRRQRKNLEMSKTLNNDISNVECPDRRELSPVLISTPVKNFKDPKTPGTFYRDENNIRIISDVRIPSYNKIPVPRELLKQWT